MTCHGIINPLGFTLEQFDSIGRRRDNENGKLIHTASDYLTADGSPIHIADPSDLARHAMESPSAHEGFVEMLFNQVAKQPIRAYGSGVLNQLRDDFAQSRFNIQFLLAETAVIAALRGQADWASRRGAAMNQIDRRQFVRNLGVSTATLPFLVGLPSLGLAKTAPRRQRLVVMFSPNGTIPKNFWPDATGSDFELKEIMKPLEPFRDRMLVLNGVNNKLQGDGDRHMRGMSCLLTGIELFPGNIQGGSDTPAGWAKGISIDQEIKNFFQGNDTTRTRFGSLEFGVGVSDRADPWTRMSYAGPNQPVAPTDDPYQMYQRLYGQLRDRDSLLSVLDVVATTSSASHARSAPRTNACLRSTPNSSARWNRSLARRTASPSSVIRRNSRSASPTRTTMSPV